MLVAIALESAKQTSADAAAAGAQTNPPYLTSRTDQPAPPIFGFWAVSDEPDQLFGNFALTTQSILSLGLHLSLGFMLWVILPIRCRPTRRSDSPATPLQIQPKMLSRSRGEIGLVINSRIIE